MIYYRSMHKRNLEEKGRKKHILILSDFSFSQFSLLDRVILSRSSFIQTNIFRKRKQLFFHFQHHHFLTTFFYSRHVIFFATFRLTLKNYFFEENEYDTHFFNFFRFLFKIKHHPISRKKQNEKPFFCIFSLEIPNTFF